MNGFNTLLMTGWFVGLYETVLGEFKHSTISKRPVPLLFISCCFSPNTAVLRWFDSGRRTPTNTNTHTHAGRHTHASVKVSC